RLHVTVSDEFLESVAHDREGMDRDLEARLNALAACVQKLSPKDREMIDRCYEPGTRIQEVANEMGRPAGTLYKALSRIRHALFDCIELAVAADMGARR